MAYFIIVFLIVLLLICWSYKPDNKQSYIDLNDFQRVIEENRCLKRDITFYKIQYIDLAKKYERLKKQSATYSNPSNPQNNQEIIEAVKYAMKKSHPDNGGNAEDFKKYRELYNRVK